MSAWRKKRKDKQEAKEDPKNVTILDKGIRKVITFEEYEKDFLNIKPEEVEEG